MHKPTVIKLIVGVVLIVAVVAATFWYGNMQRAKQTKSNQPSSNQSQSSNQNPQTLPNTDNQKPQDQTSNSNQNKSSQSTQPSTPTPAPSAPSQPPASAPQPQTNMPTTGGETSIIPLTILSTLAYMYWRSRKQTRLYK